jgi:hypothetical protein
MVIAAIPIAEPAMPATKPIAKASRLEHCIKTGNQPRFFHAFLLNNHIPTTGPAITP